MPKPKLSDFKLRQVMVNGGWIPEDHADAFLDMLIKWLPEETEGNWNDCLDSIKENLR
jgi:hypothetical protein